MRYINRNPFIVKTRKLEKLTRFNLSIYYQNVRGLNTKLNLLNSYISSSFYIFYFTATWHTTNIESTEFGFNNF